VEVSLEDPLEVSTFKDSFSFIKEPEKPSLDYPPGHFLPFPLALGLITTNDEGIVQINIYK
jgi:hypothetical protein